MDQTDKKIGYWPVAAIGIGGMVGGGIFAVLGLSVQMTHGAVPLAFLAAGLVALTTAYAYTRLSVTFPGPGGTVVFLDQAFGPGLFTGTANVLLWISYIVMLSLYAYAFGSYAAAMFPEGSRSDLAPRADQRSWYLGSPVSTFSMSKPLAGPKPGSWLPRSASCSSSSVWEPGPIDTSRIAVSSWPQATDILAGAMIIFLAYEGFELIANTAGDVREPDLTLPRAYYSAVGFVILLYVMVAAVTVGNLPVAQIVDAKDYALAEASRPFMGSFGYLLITVAALLSTLSAINATLYGAARLSYTVAKDGEVAGNPGTQIVEPSGGGPSDYQRRHYAGRQFFRSVEHLDHGQYRISAHFCHRQCRQRPSGPKTGSRRWISIGRMLLCLGALYSLIRYTWQHAPSHIWVLVAMLLLAFAVEGAYRLLAARQSSSRVLALIGRTSIRHHCHGPRRRRSKACLGTSSTDRSWRHSDSVG
jgi:amino acid transporter